MNGPCPECNRLHFVIMCAWINRQYTELGKLQQQERDHKKVCEIHNSAWYKILYQGAVVGVDVYPSPN